MASSGGKSPGKGPSPGKVTWVYTPKPTKPTDEAVLTSPNKQADSPFIRKLKSVQTGSPKKEGSAEIALANTRPPAFGSAEFEEAMAQANLDENYLKSIHTRVWQQIAGAPKSHQEVDVYVTLLALKRIIYAAELNSSLLRVFDESIEDSEEEIDPVVATPKVDKQAKRTTRSKKTEKTEVAGQTSHQGKMDVDSKGPRLRKSVRDSDKSDTRIKPIRKAKAAGTQLQPIKLSLSSEIGVDNTKILRDQFCDILSTLEIEINKNRKKEVITLSEGIKKDITNAFFTEFMSDRALSNVKAILNSYSKSFEAQLTASNAFQTQQAAKELPPVLKNFASRLATSISLQTTTGAFKLFQQYSADVSMYESYQQAVLAIYKDDELKQFFESRGYATSRGRDWRSVLKNFFCDHISKTTPRAWDNLVHAVAPLWHLVRHFGMGILLLLRGDHKTRFVNIGIGTVNAVSPIIKTVAPDFVFGVHILTETVYPAITEGRVRELAYDDLLERSGSFLANIQSCFDPDHEIKHPAKIHELSESDTSQSEKSSDNESDEDTDDSQDGGDEDSEDDEDGEGEQDDSDSKMDVD